MREGGRGRRRERERGGNEERTVDGIVSKKIKSAKNKYKGNKNRCEGFVET